ncbi:energy transducer TonB [Proteobacteria bacterium 005FR1]|nr:energy transducer TonB [Proteobacteria bacterium 005FR1]
MQSTTQSTDVTAATGERLSFTIFMAAALHGMLILGLGFSFMSRPETPPTFEVTLATHKSQQAPEQADYQAQFNQEASGTLDEARELTTDKEPLFADTRINEVQPLPETMKREAAQASDLNRIHTEVDSALQIAREKDPKEVEFQEHQEGTDRDVPPVSAEIASLRAKLSQQRQEYAKRPRIKHLSSVAAVGSAEAEYLNSWRQKVEQVGNQNFPQQALKEGIFGQLRLATVIKANGTIVQVELLESSGHSILDNAALQIIHRAAPFGPFPPEIRKDYDQLEIIRTWRFEITGLSTSN